MRSALLMRITALLLTAAAPSCADDDYGGMPAQDFAAPGQDGDFGSGGEMSGTVIDSAAPADGGADMATPPDATAGADLTATD